MEDQIIAVNVEISKGKVNLKDRSIPIDLTIETTKYQSGRQDVKVYVPELPIFAETKK